jgi:isopentenyl-diphosphate delta-isomerase
MEQVVLVDKNDNEIGIEEKIRAHENGGKLHRAFSIFIFNSKGEMLLQLRSVKKYHFGGLLTNTCCSHPRPGESLEHAIHRKLKQEFGFDTELKEKFSFTYQADFDNGLSEHEFDHVFIGTFDGEPKPNPEEIDDFKWIDMEELKKDVNENPEKYAPWFKIAIDQVSKHWKK